MAVATKRAFKVVVKRIRTWIRRHIVAEGYQDTDGFHYRKPF